ncbi:protein-tyrosine phosphatase family protein [Streptomyces fragilis]|uniref:Protein phosphatase n=1 Tax=Streptomyces fragilis TaxID=67301 RepID=A0ABV2YK78_9ACTN|nr:protein phosphatase [Streptomyces fragilis]
MKKTRQRDRDMPGPDSPWNEIRPGLWMGGHHWTDHRGDLIPAVPDREFDLVVSLFTLPGHGPHPSVEHVIAEVPDGPLTPEQIHSVQLAADHAVRAVKADRTVLVRCHSGYNRSGLVTAQALMDLDRHSPAAAIDLVRTRRSPWAFTNETFVQYLTAGLDTARLLTGLQAPT